jgi:F-box protein 21
MISAESLAPTSVMRVYLRCLNNVDNIVMGLNIERVFDKPSTQWLPIPLLSALYLRLTLFPLVDTSSANLVSSNMIGIFHELHYCPKLVMEAIGEVSQARGGSTYQMDLSLYILMMRSREIEEQRRKTLLAVTAPKRRPLMTNVKYSIGTIMKHRMYHYRCVIYGWDESCEMSEAWIAQMGVDQSPGGRHQPFYNVMAHDGSNRYASQANMIDCPSEEMGPIPHWEIGKYFTHFTGNRYIPNNILREIYPDDP